MQKVLIHTLLVIATSFFLFPVSFAFLPAGLNTKMLMAVFGVLAFVLDCLRTHSFSFSRLTLVSALIAMVFSVWCFFCITANNTEDTTYATYIVSFATWLGSAYAVCFLIRELRGKVDLEVLTFYLTLVCVSQCVLALLIDNVLPFQQVVDSVFVQGQQFMHEVDRMYGIGAALDTAGVRFSVTLLLIAHQLSEFPRVQGDRKRIRSYLLAFLFILVVGSMIARTTGVGAMLGLTYMLLSYILLNRGQFSQGQKVLWRSFWGLLVLGAVLVIYLYNNNPHFHNQFRFAFEAFFNWVERGEFRTDSTDKLNNQMWIWPSDSRSWLLGTGQFGSWFYSTDIGYCRLVLYCGIPGMLFFSLLFLYDAVAMGRKFPRTGLLFLLMLAISFIVWVKVATDLFFIYALLLCLPEPQQEDVKTCTLSTA